MDKENPMTAHTMAFLDLNSSSVQLSARYSSEDFFALPFTAAKDLFGAHGGAFQHLAPMHVSQFAQRDSDPPASQNKHRYGNLVS
jgi:hypothetical protein